MMTGNAVTKPNISRLAAPELHIVPANLADVDAVIALFGALHAYNASLDPQFALADDWESLLRREFDRTAQHPDHLWLLVKNASRAVGLLIASLHTDSPLFRFREWIEVEALYVAPSHRCMGVADRLLNQVYQWAEARQLSRIQLYVTSNNLNAQSVYTDQGFTVTQAIMRKSL
jgi:ribosomal protein S18 acetylase RimI-like enzyme